MKHQTLFSSRDKGKKNESVVCCNFARLFKGYYNLLKLSRSIWIVFGLNPSEEFNSKFQSSIFTFFF